MSTEETQLFAAWREYARRALPADASRAQTNGTRCAFFAGALVGVMRGLRAFQTDFKRHDGEAPMLEAIVTECEACCDFAKEQL